MRKEKLLETLENYDRCLEFTVNGNTITIKSGKYPNWRRFQRDLHGPTVNIQGHSYAMEHVHKRKMLLSEAEIDDNVQPEEFVDYEKRPEICIITIKPMGELAAEGLEA